ERRIGSANEVFFEPIQAHGEAVTAFGRRVVFGVNVTPVVSGVEQPTLLKLHQLLAARDVLEHGKHTHLNFLCSEGFLIAGSRPVLAGAALIPNLSATKS